MYDMENQPLIHFDRRKLRSKLLTRRIIENCPLICRDDILDTITKYYLTKFLSQLQSKKWMEIHRDISIHKNVIITAKTEIH